MRQDGGSILVEPYSDEEIEEMMQDDGKVVGYVAVEPDFAEKLEMASERELAGYAGEARELEDELAYMVIPEDFGYENFMWAYSDLDPDYDDTILEIELEVI